MFNGYVQNWEAQRCSDHITLVSWLGKRKAASETSSSISLRRYPVVPTFASSSPTRRTSRSLIYSIFTVSKQGTLERILSFSLEKKLGKFCGSSAKRMAARSVQLSSSTRYKVLTSRQLSKVDYLTLKKGINDEVVAKLVPEDILTRVSNA